MLTGSTLKKGIGKKIVKWFSAITSICVASLVFKNSFIISKTFVFVKMLKLLFFTSYSWAIRLTSLGYAKFVSSDGTQRPALFITRDRAAEKRMFGSFSLIVVPKPAYIPIYFAWTFTPLNRNASSLFSDIVYGKMDTVCILGVSIFVMNFCVYLITCMVTSSISSSFSKLLSDSWLFNVLVSCWLETASSRFCA